MEHYEYEKIEQALARAIQQVLGSNRDDFIEDTIVGSDVNQIRHLFFLLKTREIPITIVYNSEFYRGTVQEMLNTSVMIKVSGLEEGGLRRCQLRFEALSVMYQFEVLILEFLPEALHIRIPFHIQSARHRKYKRIFVNDLFMRFTTIYQPFFDSAIENQIVENRYYFMIQELIKETPDLNLVFRIFMEQIAAVSRDHKLVFFQDRKPEGPLEETLVRERKTIFLDDLNQLENYFVRIKDHRVVNLNSMYNQITKESSEEDAVAFFENLRRKLLSEFYYKVILCPISIFEEIVGYVFVYTTVLETIHISRDQAQNLDLLVQVFNQILNKTVISRSYYSHPITPIRNISLSGLLFHIEDENLFNHLIFHDRLKMDLQLKHDTLSMIGEISRYFPVESGYNIGINFYDANPGGFQILENFIYDKNRILEPDEVRR